MTQIKQIVRLVHDDITTDKSDGPKDRPAIVRIPGSS